MPDTAIVNASTRYVNGLTHMSTAARTLVIDPGAARDNTNTNEIILNSSLTLDMNGQGVNGIDIGSPSATSLYAIYIIGDSRKYQPTASLVSLDFTQPLLPFGYDMFRRIGFLKTDIGSNIRSFTQRGNGQIRNYTLAAGEFVVTGGNSTSPATVSASNYVSPTAIEMISRLQYSPNSASNLAQIWMYPYSSSTTYAAQSGAASLQYAMIAIPLGLNGSNPSFIYQVSDALDSLDIVIVGFTDNLI